MAPLHRDNGQNTKRPSRDSRDCPPAPAHRDEPESACEGHEDTCPAPETPSRPRALCAAATLPTSAPPPLPPSASQCESPSRAARSIVKELQSDLAPGYYAPLLPRRKSSVKDDSTQASTPKPDKPATPRSRVPSRPATPKERPHTQPAPVPKKVVRIEPPPKMPTAIVNKRVKTLRISRNIIIGSEAVTLPPVGDPKRDPSIPEQHTKRWTIYVRQPEGGPDMRIWLTKVSFKIHTDYKQPLRIIENPPYSVTETGWGGFPVDVRLFFTPSSTEKPQYRTHFLQLEPYGTPVQQEKQLRDGLVRSEFLEVVEFNEPIDAFVESLTSEQQFDYLKDPKQCGAQWGVHVVKGRKKALSPAEGTAQLPAKSALGGSTEESQFSTDQEDASIRDIAQQSAQVDKMLAEELEKKAKVTQRLAELRGDLGAEAAAQATKEASGDRVRRR